MSEQNAGWPEFDGEELEACLVARRDGQRAADGDPHPDGDGRAPTRDRLRRQLVELGYNAFVADLFGKRFRGAPRDTMFGAMTGLRGDRAALRDRLLAVLEQVARARACRRATGSPSIGYCFGGQCALDVARTGADIAGVASFHGLFDPPGLPPQPIKAKVVAFHGWDDPMVPPDAVVALGKELTEAGADWQIHAYGHVGHGFTNPNASELGIDGVAYNALAAERSWTQLHQLARGTVRLR